jgi:hypothetical protein
MTTTSNTSRLGNIMVLLARLEGSIFLVFLVISLSQNLFIYRLVEILKIIISHLNIKLTHLLLTYLFNIYILDRMFKYYGIWWYMVFLV